MILRLINITLMCLLLWKLPQSPQVAEIMPPTLSSAQPIDQVAVAETHINRAMAERILTDPASLLAEPRLIEAIGLRHSDQVTVIDELQDRLVFTVRRGPSAIQLVVMINDEPRGLRGLSV